jgi:hypothetical protein
MGRLGKGSQAVTCRSRVGRNSFDTGVPNLRGAFGNRL